MFRSADKFYMAGEIEGLLPFEDQMDLLNASCRCGISRNKSVSLHTVPDTNDLADVPLMKC